MVFKSKLVKERGYPLEIHDDIETDDGYLLTMQRIPYGRKDTNINAKRPPVLLVHGAFGSAVHYTFDSPDKGLAYILADEGFDVWLGNYRSVSCSKKHKYYDNTSERFYDYTAHEVAIYDVKAKIDYILNVTNSAKMFYVGHSQGTMSFFILCSEMPEYNDKFKLFIALSPAGYVYNMTHPFVKFFWLYENYLYEPLKSLGFGQIPPVKPFFDNVGRPVCSLPIFNHFCSIIFQLLGGFNMNQFQKEMIPYFMHNFPDTISLKVFSHIAKMHESEYFGQFDYGPEMNMMRYGNYSAPRYDLRKVTAPLALYYAKNDWLVNSENVVKMAEEFPNVVDLYEVPDEDFTHMDFLWARDRVELLYNRIIDVMRYYKAVW